jgi:apolipoprotein N-acyltransferase
MARLRAIENGYSLIRVDFIGVSAAFDPYGRVLAMQDTVPRQSHMMMVDLPVQGVSTLYHRTGDIFAWLCIAATFGLCAYGVFRPVRGFPGRCVVFQVPVRRKRRSPAWRDAHFSIRHPSPR